MSLLRDAAHGIDGFFRAFRFAMKHGMGWMFLVPVLLWILLAYGLFVLLAGPVDQLTAWVGQYLEIPVAKDGEGFWGDLLEFLNGARELFVSLLLKLGIAYLMFVANKYIVLILLSPLLAYASERTEEVLTGSRYPFTWSRLLLDALRGSVVAVRNGVIELLISIVLWLFTLFVPLSAPLTLLFLFLVSAYFYGYSMFDYLFERRRMRIGESTRAAHERLGAVLANGALFSALMKIPLLGMMCAPVMASIGAVIAEVERGEDRE